jgi:VWFA-related protein
MTGTRKLDSVLLCFLFALPGGTAQAPSPDSDPPVQSAPQPQLIPRSHEEREIRYQSLHRIVMNISVTDDSGRSVPGLLAQDFTLLRDEASEPVTSFREVRRVSGHDLDHVILVLDTVNNSLRNIASDKKEIENYLKRGTESLPYPMSIAVVSESGTDVSNPSQDRAVLLRELDALGSRLHTIGCADEVNPNESFLAVWMPGGVHTPDHTHQLACLNERFIRSLSALRALAVEQKNIPGRAILIWIGPGWPLLNNPQFRPDDEEVKQNFFDNLVGVSQALIEAQVTLDVLSPAGVFRKTELESGHALKGVEKEDDVSANSLAPQVLARQSGGRIVVYGKNIPEGISACIADLDSYYVLTFNSAPAATPGEYHSLDVKIDKPGLTLRTNSMYYAEQ